jgi:nucleotide-binding universal stress UspA family protein
VVGIDGVNDDLRALRWAAAEAGLLEAQLLIIHAYGCLPRTERSSAARARSADATAQAGAAARSVIDKAVRRVRALGPEVSVSGEAVEGDPVSVLLRKAQQAQMIVLGSRRLGAWGSLLLGSTGQAVAERAHCPVILVRAEPHPEAGDRVVVGVDADEEAVLAFAFGHARRRRARLEAVACWKSDLRSATSLLEEAAAAERIAATQLLEHRLQPWCLRFPDVPVTRTVLERRPVAGLISAAANQQLLVVGRRGSHPVSGPLLGSVNLGVLHCCESTVAIVPVIGAVLPPPAPVPAAQPQAPAPT